LSKTKKGVLKTVKNEVFRTNRNPFKNLMYKKQQALSIELMEAGIELTKAITNFLNNFKN